MQPACCIRLGYFSYCNVTLLQYRDIGPWFWLSKAIAFRCWECLVENVVQFMGMEEGLVLMDMKEYTIVKILLSSKVASLFFWKQICKYCMWLRWWFSYRLHNLSFFFIRGFAVGIYTTNSAEACHYVAENCKANILVVENHKQLQKILQVSNHQ